MGGRDSKNAQDCFCVFDQTDVLCVSFLHYTKVSYDCRGQLVLFQAIVSCEPPWISLYASGSLQSDHQGPLRFIGRFDAKMLYLSPPDISELEIIEVTEALRSGWITTGPRTKMLERRLAAYIETGRTDVDCSIEELIYKQTDFLSEDCFD